MKAQKIQAKKIERNRCDGLQFKSKIARFNLNQQFTKQLCTHISNIILEDSILALNKMDDFFLSLIKVLEKLKKGNIKSIRNYINQGQDLKSIYYAVQNKLLLLKEYPYYQKASDLYFANFENAVKFTNLVRQLLQGKKLKFQKFSNSEVLSSSKSETDVLILKYLNAKLNQSQDKSALNYFSKQTRLFDPQYEYTKYLQKIQNNCCTRIAQAFTTQKKYFSNNHFYCQQNKGCQNISKSNCILCSSFYTLNVRIEPQKICSSDLVIFQGVKKMRQLEQNQIKKQIVAFCNSDRPGIIQFDCVQSGLDIIPKGYYMTQKQKESFQQTFYSLIDSIQPKLQIQKDFKMQFVPLKYHPSSNQSDEFIPGAFVMRVKIAPSRIAQSKLYKCRIDGAYYCYKRQNKKNIKIQQKDIERQELRRKNLYSLLPTGENRCQQYIPENFHYGSCETPNIGKQEYVYNRKNYQSFNELINSLKVIPQSFSREFQSAVLIVANTNWIQNLHRQFQEFGIQNFIKNSYKSKFKMAESTLIMKYNGKFQRISDAISNQTAKKKNYFRIGSKPIIVINVGDYLKLKNTALSQEDFKQLIKELREQDLIKQLREQDFKNTDIQVWNESYGNDSYIRSSQKNIIIYSYLKFKDKFKKSKTQSDVNFRSPQSFDNLKEIILPNMKQRQQPKKQQIKQEQLSMNEELMIRKLF